MEAVVVHRVGFLEYFCPKQGEDFKPSVAPIYPNMGKLPLPPPGFLIFKEERFGFAFLPVTIWANFVFHKTLKIKSLQFCDFLLSHV